MQFSPTGLALTKFYEGCELKAYRDIAGVWTIGYGHTGPDVHEGLVITQAQADDLLTKDMAAAEQCVNDAVHVSMTQGEYDSLVDFTFNVGDGSLEHSTLLADLNARNDRAAAAQFALWDHAAGRINGALARRRADEAAMFEGVGA